MIDVKNKRCQEVGCNKRPGFSFNGLKTLIFCKDHKKECTIDVVNKR